MFYSYFILNVAADAIGREYDFAIHDHATFSGKGVGSAISAVCIVINKGTIRCNVSFNFGTSNGVAAASSRKGCVGICVFQVDSAFCVKRTCNFRLYVTWVKNASNIHVVHDVDAGTCSYVTCGVQVFDAVCTVGVKRTIHNEVFHYAYFV